MLLSVAYQFWRRSTARDIAQAWLLQNHYRMVSIRTPWFRTIGFGSLWLGGSSSVTPLLRSSNNAFDFIATVDDRDLGGSGEIRLRVWLDWFGSQMGDVEIVWNQTTQGTEGEAPEPLMDRLADAQLDVLRRVAAGETTFYAPRRNEPQTRDFDTLIDHVFALATRGMLTHGAPVEDGRGGIRYSSIGSLAIAPAGQKWLESQSSRLDSRVPDDPTENSGTERL